jgi:hypothetical protein
MQVRVAKQDERTPHRLLRPLGAWTIAWIGLLLAVSVSLRVLVPAVEPVDVLTLAAVFLGLVAAESFNVEFEFRKSPRQ